ncbi:MAG: sensor histidine kinase [Acidobacteriota bacterium]|nr:sensor histidine kinase [Acidobacteriota bacterium]
MRLLPHNTDLGWTPYAWLIYIVPFIVTPFVDERQANVRGFVTYAVALVVFVALYLRSYWVRGRELVLLSAMTLAMGLAFWPISYGAGAFFIYASAMIGLLDSPRWAVRGVVVIAIITILEAVILRRPLWHASWPVAFVLIIGGINIHYSQVGRANARLRLAQDEIEHMAKLAERERIARDLHDLLGHTLSLVVLKSELASKLAERDPERSREEIRDVERIAREALAEVRAAVSGYRTSGLEAEVQRARNTLSTAGVRLETDIAQRKLPPAQEAVLCLALREAITNIVRHAGARNCKLAVDCTDSFCTLSISDDGRGGNAPFGSGLSGMRERVDVLGGSLTRNGTSGTTIIVTLPLGSNVMERSA